MRNLFLTYTDFIRPQKSHVESSALNRRSRVIVFEPSQPEVPKIKTENISCFFVACDAPFWVGIEDKTSDDTREQKRK
jgi:hypothetical protein